MPSETFDCAIVGAGPAGLTAALYLRRFHRDIVVFDADRSRAKWIPESHNCPGFPQGVSGTAFLDKLREQASHYGVDVLPKRIQSLARTGADFVLRAGPDSWRAKSVLLATGIVDELPDAPWVEDAIQATAMRLCAICDGYEASDGRLATFGKLDDAIPHAIFLRSFSKHVIAAGSDGNGADEALLAKARQAGVEVLSGVRTLAYDGTHCQVIDADGGAHAFDALYPVLGCHAQSELATAIGAAVDDNGELIVAKDQLTSVPGLYAIGDVVSAINQISVATGHAAIAATAIHNALPANPA